MATQVIICFHSVMDYSKIFISKNLEKLLVKFNVLLFFLGNLCTYLNWPRAHRCTQCQTPRRRVSPGARKNASTPEVQSNASQPPTLENLRISTPPPSKWSCKHLFTLYLFVYKHNSRPENLEKVQSEKLLK